jgi:transposase
MKINTIDIEAAIQKARDAIDKDEQLSASSKSIIEVLILLITFLAGRLNLNSKNSSKPPSSDPNRKKEPGEKTGNSPGGQKGHIGKTLGKVDDPDIVELIEIDRSKLPPGKYRDAGYESRQVFDIDIARVVTEYRAQILVDASGNHFVAAFPEGVGKAVQYGTGLKGHAVYMSQFQLIPYNRIQDYFADHIHIPVSEGSIYNFNQEAYSLLADFENRAKQELANSEIAHADETGINKNGDRWWLHCLSNPEWTLFFPHEKRGKEAMDAMGVLPGFKGTLCHDHWKPYYTYGCIHALCNAHHLRELTFAWEQEGQQWAKKMKDLLETINNDVIANKGVLGPSESRKYRQNYKDVIKKAEIECPEPEKPPDKKRGRIKKSKSRNLLERLRDYEDDVLRFMENKHVPFTNNLGENDIRMTKVQQKISGCFRSMEGAQLCCRIRSYLSTCRKHGVKPSHALNLLFEGKRPEFLR